jgi:hypothetical protein
VLGRNPRLRQPPLGKQLAQPAGVLAIGLRAALATTQRARFHRLGHEAALSARRPSSPDHADYQALKARGLSHTRASLTIARKLARRSFHILRELGPAALDPIPTS